MIQYKKLMMTLALLLTAVTGAWADEPKVYTTAVDVTSLKVGDILAQGFSLTSTNPNGAIFNIADQRGKRGETIHPGGYGGLYTKNITAYGANATFTTADGTYYPIDENSNVGNAWVVTQECNQLMDMDLIIAGVTIEPPLKVTWNASTKTGTFAMPGSDVVLTPIYAAAARWATESDVELLPTAAEGVIAGTDAPLIVEGTVATGQGTVMYFATTEQLTAEQAAQANGWLSTLPTAADYDDATTVYVWYYIQGADTPDGQEATAENTFNDSEICATPLEVSVLSNKFDITFNAANANTIEGQNGKGTVTVKTGDAEAVDKTADIDAEHQLKAVKMGSTVTITTKEGYKFRKVEAKKGEAPATPEGPTLAQTLTTANMTVKVYYTYSDTNNTCEFLSNGDGTYTFQSGTGYVGGDNGKAKALVVENGKLVFKQNFYATIGQLWDKVGISITFDTSENTYSIWKGSNETLNPSLSKVEVNGTQIALTQQ